MGIEPTKERPEGMPGWLDRVAASKTSPKTLERYREIVEKNIIPSLGSIRLQRLSPEDIETFYANALISGRRDGRGGLSPQSVLHIHRILSLALQSAVKKQHIPHSPMQGVENVPTVEQREIQTLSEDDLKTLLQIFKGKSLYVPVMTATATGMRRGEILGLRWRDIDFSAHNLTVQQSVEQTKEGLRFKPPKTKRSRRKIALPPRLIEELKNHKRQQAEQRLTLGLGKDPNDLVFTTLDGRPRSPRTFSKEFTRTIEAANRKAKLAGGSTLLPRITFHILRHTHISNLLAGGINVKTVSDRAGHADPAITLRIYAHAIPGLDEAAATLVDASLRAALED